MSLILIISTNCVKLWPKNTSKTFYSIKSQYFHTLNITQLKSCAGIYRQLSVQNVTKFFASAKYVNKCSNNKIEMVCKRYLSEDRSPDESKSNKTPLLMAFNPIVLPNLWFKCKNFITINTIIRPFFDNDFTIDKLMTGTKQALVHISNRLADGDLDSLNGLVSDEALDEIRQNYPKLDASQRQDLRIDLNDIIYSFVHTIGIIMNDNNDRWVEITVVFYCLYKYQSLKQQPNLSFEEFKEKFGTNIIICNYRFIREYTKGVESEWTVNQLGHFHNKGTID
ncbi:uncharacterized protein LOC128958616 [Oppia nitens]|uniref:uncharacterized protein LOC128958616 n=1 Tax=Oppia nitens TaxID=1686743 RepID=UPI0023DA4C11|nr:uncharacterized protein LOC128958616 [Oppia nitens]